MMNSGSSSMLAVPNSFWPFSYPLKPYDLSIHPAFIHSSYRSLQGVQYGLPTTGNVRTEKTKSDTFTIDAILNRDNSRDNGSTAAENVQNSYSASVAAKRDKLHCESSRRRHHRLYEASHPYAEVTSGADKESLQRHIQTTYKHYTDSIRTDKTEKKAGEEWNKQTKGKRVRTIFTPEQLERMEAEFERQQYMVGTERYYLATSLNLTEAQVKVWFQNRRIKWRKQHLEQQQAKLKTLDIYKDAAESESDSETDDETRTSADENTHLLADPFQSPKEARYTQ